MYEVWLWRHRNDLLQTYICTLKAYWEVSSSKCYPWTALHLATVGNVFGTSFAEQLSVTSWQFYGCLQYPEIFVSFIRQTLFLEKARSRSKPSQGKGAGVPFQQSIFGPETAWQRAPCELEHCHGGETNRWVKVQAFFYTASCNCFNIST
jgi:hypothetical protein